MAVRTKRLTVVEHPLVQHKLSYLRDKDTPTVHFRKLANEITLLLTYEATKDLPTEDYEIDTPLEKMTAQRISGKKVAVCPVLRAGVGMLDGVLSLVSSARVGFIGMYRDEETLQPVQYYSKLPTDLSDREHPDVHIVCAAVDRGLDGRGFIVPGLGDAGDRLYGTK
jgi:uracil phosphoribosyltransferase